MVQILYFPHSTFGNSGMVSVLIGLMMIEAMNCGIVIFFYFGAS